MEAKRYTDCLTDAARRDWIQRNSEPGEQRDNDEITTLRTIIGSHENTINALLARIAELEATR